MISIFTGFQTIRMIKLDQINYSCHILINSDVKSLFYYFVDLFRLWLDSIHCYSKLEEDQQTSGENISASDGLNPPVVIVGTWKDDLTSESEEVKNL